MNKLLNFVLKHPVLIIIIYLFLSVAFATQLPNITLDPSVKGMMPEDFPSKLMMDEIEDIFGGSEAVLLAIDADTLFSPEALKELSAIHYDLENLNSIEEVTSIINAKEIKGTDEGMEVDDLVPELPSTLVEATDIRERALANSIVKNNLLSDDGNATVIVGIIKPGKINEVELKNQINTIIRENAKIVNVSAGGLPIIRGHIAENMQGDMRKFMPVGIVLMLLLLFMSFKTLRGVFLPFSVVIMSTIWVFGLMSFLNIPLSFIGILIPVIMISVANDYGIHIVARYYEDVLNSKSHDRDEIVLSGMLHLGTPVMLAGITTIIGFSSLLTHPLPSSRDIGYFASFGIAAAFFMSITFIPAWLKLLPVPEKLKSMKQGFTQKWLKGLAERLISWRKGIIIASIIVVIISLMGIPILVVDTNPINYFSKDTDIVESTNILNSRFGGSTLMNIIFTGDMKDPDNLRQMNEIQSQIGDLDEVGRTQSLTDVLKLMNRAMHSDSVEWDIIPDSRELIAQYMLLYSMSADPEDFDRLVDYEYTKTQIISRLNVMSTDSITLAVNKINALNKETDEGEKLFEVAGMSVLLKDLLPLVVNGQIISLMVSIILVLIVVAIALRSVIAGVFTIIPLSIAVLMVFGAMGYAKIELNVATAMLSSILIGIGVDYTIHFIWRFREEMRNSGNNESEALAITLTNTGRGIVYNAYSVIVGFSVLLLSFFLPIYFFGFLLTFSIFACLTGAITVLPALILTFKPKFIYNKEN